MQLYKTALFEGFEEWWIEANENIICMLYAFEHLQDYPDDTQIIIFKINTISRNEENFPKKSPIYYHHFH